MTMTTGELDYDKIFHQQEDREEIALPPVSFILWMILMPILLSNLMVSYNVWQIFYPAEVCLNTCL